MDKILFADDDLEIRDLINDILSKEGFEVVLAKDGNEAMSLAKANKPSAIILDYLMPGLNGVEVCTQLKKDKELKGIPIIMITAYPNEKEKGLNAGAMDFLTKPIDKFDLLLRLKSALKIKHINNELQKIIAYIAELEK